MSRDLGRVGEGGRSVESVFGLGTKVENFFLVLLGLHVLVAPSLIVSLAS